MAVGVVVLALMASAPSPTAPVVVESWPSVDVAAVTLGFGLDAEQVPRGREGISAVYAELLLGEMNVGLRESRGPGSKLITRIPSRRGVDVERRRDYLAITVNTTQDGVLAAIEFLRRFVLEARFSAEEVEAARKVVLQRRDVWLRSMVEPTEELLVRAMWDGAVGDCMYGSAESIKAIQVSDIERFASAVAARGNACFAIVGSGEDAEEWRRSAEAAVSALPEARQLPRGSRLGLGGRVMVDENPAIDRASLAVGAPLPPFGEKEHWAAWIVREMLAGPDGRLCSDRTLLSKSGLIVPSTLAWRQWPISPLPIQFGSRPYLAVVALCHPARVEVTRQGILRHIAEIAEGEFTEADLERARVRVANTWARELAAPRDRARMLALAAMLGIELPSVDQVWKVVNEISEAEVKEAAYSVLRRVSVGLQMPST